MAEKHEFIEIIHKKRVELFIKQISKADKILDLGCAGYPLCIDYQYDSKIVGINLPCQQFDKIIKFGYNESFIVGDVTLLPFRNNSFDLVFAGELIEHLKDTLLFKNEWVSNLWNNSIYRKLTLKMGEFFPKYAYLIMLVAKKY